VIKQRVNQVLSQPVSRRTFLGQLGLVALAVIGIPAILKSLELKHTASNSDSANGYGSSAYGGRLSSRPKRRML